MFSFWMLKLYPTTENWFALCDAHESYFHIDGSAIIFSLFVAMIYQTTMQLVKMFLLYN